VGRTSVKPGINRIQATIRDLVFQIYVLQNIDSPIYVELCINNICVQVCLVLLFLYLIWRSDLFNKDCLQRSHKKNSTPLPVPGFHMPMQGPHRPNIIHAARLCVGTACVPSASQAHCNMCNTRSTFEISKCNTCNIHLKTNETLETCF
jgi:hypothetical protein